jgi:PAS domain-containing protein
MTGSWSAVLYYAKNEDNYMFVIIDMLSSAKNEDTLTIDDYRSLVNQSNDGIVITDEDGTVITWNNAQELLTGFLKRRQKAEYP